MYSMEQSSAQIGKSRKLYRVLVAALSIETIALLASVLFSISFDDPEKNGIAGMLFAFPTMLVLGIGLGGVFLKKKWGLVISLLPAFVGPSEIIFVLQDSIPEFNNITNGITGWALEMGSFAIGFLLVALIVVNYKVFSRIP